MASFLIHLVVFTKLSIRNLLLRPSLSLLRLIILIRKPKITLCYDAINVRDGSGAQIQRIMAIYSLAKYLGLSYLHKPIEEVSIHPLDPHQSAQLYSEYLMRLNSVISIPSDSISLDFENKIVEPKLTFGRALRHISDHRESTGILIKLSDVYSLVDANTKIYQVAVTHIQSNIQREFAGLSSANENIVVHYRSVPGKFSTYPGESRTRQLEVKRLAKVLKRAIKKNRSAKSHVEIYTDAPEQDQRISVSKSQQNLWENTPGYDDGFLQLNGVDFRSELSAIGKEIMLHVGGDPLEALARMSGAKTLIISKSSLSYVASLLNKNQDIYSPFEFWHPVPKSVKF